MLSADNSRHTRKRQSSVVRVPALAQFPWLVHGFSTRQGGVSICSNSHDPTARGNDLNLGNVAWDSPRNVAENRRRLLTHLKAHQMLLAVPRQIHSDLIRVLDESASPTASLVGDGLVTEHPGLLLSIQTADCLPILLVDARQRVVAALHCGWRGTVRRLAQKGVGVMKHRFGSREQDLWVAVGPGIRDCCYRVGQEVIEEFQGQFHYAAKLFVHRAPSPTAVQKKYPLLFRHVRGPFGLSKDPIVYLNLVEANVCQLRDAGIPASQIYSESPCTSCHPELFFSHRRDNGKTGRMMGVIGIRS